MQMCHSSVTKLGSIQAVHQRSEKRLVQSQIPHQLHLFFFMKLILHSYVQLHTLFSNININTESSANLTLDRVSNICQMRIQLMFTSCMTLLQRTRLIGRCQYYKIGLIKNRSVASVSTRHKLVLFLFAGPHNDTFYINNQVATP